ncbi:hypothetical protein [Streptomyces sp. NPDC060187]|uniref:hypothetical protein n=1 Tax=Streptomyces sp. NPDC060187 TaxID=3347067 RepID=UPI0036580FED
MIDSMTWRGGGFAGLIDDLVEDDDARGPEPDDDASLRVVLPFSTFQVTALLASPAVSGLQQCERCGGWFGVTFWACAACQNLRLAKAHRLRTGAGAVMTDSPPLPMRPTPHERDGRDQPPRPPARPHPNN